MTRFERCLLGNVVDDNSSVTDYTIARLRLVICFFPNKTLFSSFRIATGLNDLLSPARSRSHSLVDGNASRWTETDFTCRWGIIIDGTG